MGAKNYYSFDELKYYIPKLMYSMRNKTISYQDEIEIVKKLGDIIFNIREKIDKVIKDYAKKYKGKYYIEWGYSGELEPSIGELTRVAGIYQLLTVTLYDKDDNGYNFSIEFGVAFGYYELGNFVYKFEYADDNINEALWNIIKHVARTLEDEYKKYSIVF